MSESHVIDDLLAYMNGNLDRTTARGVEDHLVSCDACRREYDTLKSFWELLATSADEAPDPSLRRRFDDLLTKYERDSRRTGVARTRSFGLLDRILYGRPALQLGFAAGLLVVGLAGGLALGGRTGANDEMSQLREEVRGLRNLVAVSLLQQESASERLKGVSWSSRLDEADPDIRNALLNTMRHDRNVNVRLAALNALTGNLSIPAVRSEILRALTGEKYPLMQLALADAIVRINDAEAREALRQALMRPDLHPDVRKRIKEGVQLIL